MVKRPFFRVLLMLVLWAIFLLSEEYIFVSAVSAQVRVGPAQYPITVKIEEASLKDVLEHMRNMSGGITVVFDERLAKVLDSKVTIEVCNVPWINALEMILRHKGLTYRIEDDIVWVTNQENLEQQEIRERQQFEKRFAEDIKELKRDIQLLKEKVFAEEIESFVQQIQDIRHRCTDFGGEREIEERLRIYGPTAVPYLLKALKSEDARIRQGAAFALGIVEDSRTSKALIVALNDENEEVREESATSLGKRKEVLAVPNLITRLEDKSEWVAGAAVQALGQIGDSRAVPFLVNLLETSPDIDRSVITDALRLLTGQDFGLAAYHGKESDAKNKEIVAKWRQWLQENKIAPLNKDRK